MNKPKTLQKQSNNALGKIFLAIKGHYNGHKGKIRGIRNTIHFAIFDNYTSNRLGQRTQLGYLYPNEYRLIENASTKVSSYDRYLLQYFQDKNNDLSITSINEFLCYKVYESLS